MARVALYKYDEASSGSGPTSVADSDASPASLAITYGTGGAWTSNGAGKGLNFGLLGNTHASISCSGTKYTTALGGVTQASMTAAWDVNSADTYVSFGFENIGSSDVFDVIQSSGTATLYVHDVSSTFDISGVANGYHVYTVVLDTTQSTQTNRAKLYVDGVQVTTSTCNLGLNATLTVTSSATLIPGNANASNGAIYSLLIHNTALDGATISTIAAALLSNNDADPEGGGGGGGGPPLWTYSQRLLSGKIPHLRM